MIILCDNCAKKFKLDSALIPEKGRLLRCNSCNHKWFFKKEIINKPISSINIVIPTKVEAVSIKKSEPINIESSENIELLDNQVKDSPILEKISTNIDENNTNQAKKADIEKKIELFKDKKNYNLFGLTIIFIISFIALIIILDTFQAPISKIVPNIEFILYNLYQTLNDIKLFLNDLI